MRGTKPVDFTAPTTEAVSTDEYIILYQRAFENIENLQQIVVHEATHIMILDEWSSEFEKYRKDFG